MKTPASYSKEKHRLTRYHTKKHVIPRGQEVTLKVEVRSRIVVVVVGHSEGEGSIAHYVGGGILIVFLSGEVGLQDVDYLLVDFVVAVALKGFDVIQTAALFNQVGVFVASVIVSVLLADLQQVLQSLEGDQDDTGITTSQQFAHRLDEVVVDHVADLFAGTTRGSVTQGPSGFLLDVEVGVLEEEDQTRNDHGVDDGLDLDSVSGSNVGDSPAGLLLDSLLRGVEQGAEARKNGDVDDDLGLVVITSYDVTDSTKGRGLDRVGGMEEELDHLTGDTNFDDGLNTLVGSIRKVRKSPAGVGQNLVVGRIDEASQSGESRGYQFPSRLRLASAQVGQSPGGVSEHGELRRLDEVVEEWFHDAMVQHVVTAARRVSSDVTESPHGLLANVVRRRGQEFLEDGDGTSFNDNLGLIGRTRGNVGKSPSSFKLLNQYSDDV